MRSSDLISLAVAGVFSASAALADAPQRVVSVNLCTDQLAMMLADEGQLVSVSYMSLDPATSPMWERAASLIPNRAGAEEIYLLDPDLVIAGTFTAPATIAMLSQLDIPLIQLAPSNSLEDVRTRVREVGAALHQTEKAEQMVADFDARLSEITADIQSRPTAALYAANGYTSGDQTLAGQILTAAGFDNVADAAGFPQGGFMPLETLAMIAPDVVIASQPVGPQSRAQEILSHPVLTGLNSDLDAGSLRDADWVCGTPFVLRAIEDLAKARRALEGRDE